MGLHNKHWMVSVISQLLLNPQPFLSRLCSLNPKSIRLFNLFFLSFQKYCSAQVWHASCRSGETLPCFFCLFTSRLLQGFYVPVSAKITPLSLLVQNATAGLLTQSKEHDHITPIEASLHCLPVNFRIHFWGCALDDPSLHLRHFISLSTRSSSEAVRALPGSRNKLLN